MKTNNKSLMLAMGTTLLGTLSVTAQAREGIFVMNELSSGYMQLAAETTTTDANKTKVPEAKCAGAKPISAAPKTSEGKCGEGKCGGTMKAAESGKAAPATTDASKSPADATKAKAAEGKCGEGKCGGEMKKSATASSNNKTASDGAAKK